MGKTNQQKLDNLFTRERRDGLLSRLGWIQFILCILIIGLYLFILRTGVLERFENIFYDSFLHARPPLSVDPAIAIIEIDDESIKAIGQWPWPWRYHAEMLNFLRQWQAKAVVFDFIFEDSDIFDEDNSFEEALQKTPHVYLPIDVESSRGKKIWVHSLPIVLEPSSDRKVWIHSAPHLEKYVQGIGHQVSDTDFDGVLRKIRPSIDLSGVPYPHLALRVAYDFLKEPLPTPDGRVFPVDDQGNLWISWAGKWKESFARYSYVNLIRSSQAVHQGLKPLIDPEKIRGKICLIGLTAKSLADLKVTPLESNLPGVATHANLINNVLTKHFISGPSFVVNAALLVCVGLLASLLFVVFRNVASFVAGLFLGVVCIGVSFIFFLEKGIWLYAVHPLFLILTLFIFSAIYDNAASKKERSRLFNLATRDGLTGLYVIRHFREMLNQVVLEAGQNKKPLSLILIDIDDFKAINDTYGHPAGDMVIKKIAETVYSCFRTKRPMHEADFVARYGGEEFIVMLRNASLENVAITVAERIRAAVCEATFQWEEKIFPVTVSLGVAVLHPGEAIPDPMVRRADEALYRAKREGKNRVVVEGRTSD